MSLTAKRMARATLAEPTGSLVGALRPAAASQSRGAFLVSTMTTYRRDQWVTSFEGQMSILRPHLTGRMLGTISAAAWQQYGTKGVDPIQAAKDESAAIDGRQKPQARG